VLQLVCLMFTHGWKGGNMKSALQMRQLVPGNIAVSDFTAPPYPFEGNDADNINPCQLFGPAAWTTHSCAPNVWASSFSPLQVLTLIARRDIHVGDRITVSLVDEGRGTNIRQQLLQRLCDHDCDCERCRRPCWVWMMPSPLGPCAACGFKLVGLRGSNGCCGACGERGPQQLDRILYEAASKVVPLSEEYHALNAAAQAPGMGRCVTCGGLPQKPRLQLARAAILFVIATACSPGCTTA
jgi:hypothetical protein